MLNHIQINSKVLAIKIISSNNHAITININWKSHLINSSKILRKSKSIMNKIIKKKYFSADPSLFKKVEIHWWYWILKILQVHVTWNRNRCNFSKWNQFNFININHLFIYFCKFTHKNILLRTRLIIIIIFLCIKIDSQIDK